MLRALPLVAEMMSVSMEKRPGVEAQGEDEWMEIMATDRPGSLPSAFTLSLPLYALRRS